MPEFSVNYMAKLDERIATFEQEMAVLSGAEDPDLGKLADVDKALRQAREEYEGLVMEWLELGEELEG